MDGLSALLLLTAAVICVCVAVGAYEDGDDGWAIFYVVLAIVNIAMFSSHINS